MENTSEIPPEILAWAKRSAEMRSRTQDEMVQKLWQFCDDGMGHLHFVLETPTKWETTKPAWHDFGFAELSPDRCDPPGSGPAHVLPPRVNTLGCRVEITPIRLDAPENGRSEILKAIRSAQVLADVFSLLSTQPAVLRAARRMEGSWSSDLAPRDPPSPPGGKTHFLIAHEPNEELMSRIVSDEWVDTRVGIAAQYLASIPDEHVRRTVEAALSLHAQANALRGQGRYLHYWASIELLGAFFYEYLDASYLGRATQAETETSVLRKLLDINSKNYRDTITECHRLLRPTARQQIIALAKLVLPGRPEIRKTLFDKARDAKGRPVEGARSMYDIRNDIAHGNVSPLLREYFDENVEVLERFQGLSQEFILAVLGNATALCARRRPGFAEGGAGGDDERDDD